MDGEVVSSCKLRHYHNWLFHKGQPLDVDCERVGCKRDEIRFELVTLYADLRARKLAGDPLSSGDEVRYAWLTREVPYGIWQLLG